MKIGGGEHEVLTIPCESDGGRNPIIIVADPFLYEHHDELFLFYEEKRLLTPGILRMMHTKDLKSWSEPITVLQEPFHLSYPFVFEDNNKVYMIPETCKAGEVRLYQADNDDLTSFSQVSVLMGKDTVEHVTIDYSDSSVLKHDGKYYLMTTREIDFVNHLYLYVSDNLTGPYSAHPLSPVCASRKFGRNAGSLIQYNGKLFRVAQDCENRYGDNVLLMEVQEMNEQHYREVLVWENIYDTTIPFYKEGGHQLNIVEYNGRLVIATDAKEYHPFLITRVRNIISKRLSGRH